MDKFGKVWRFAGLETIDTDYQRGEGKPLNAAGFRVEGFPLTALLS